MWESFFGFKKTPFSDSPDLKQLFASAGWKQVQARLEFLAQHHGVGLLTGEVGAGKSTVARVFTAALNPNLYKILYVHFSSGTALDLLRQIALALDLQPAHYRGDLVRQIAEAIVRKRLVNHPSARERQGRIFEECRKQDEAIGASWWPSRRPAGNRYGSSAVNGESGSTPFTTGVDVCGRALPSASRCWRPGRWKPAARRPPWNWR
jgi:hypothetical protein